MTKKQAVKALVAERLTTAVEEIFCTVERMITERRTLDTPGKRLCYRTLLTGHCSVITVLIRIKYCGFWSPISSALCQQKQPTKQTLTQTTFL